MEKLYINDPVSSNATNHPNKLPPPTFQARNKGRGQTQGQMTYQPVPPHRQTNRIPSQNQVNAFQKTPVQNRSVSESPPKVSGPTHALESTELTSPLESYNSKMVYAGKGKGGLQVNGMGSFPYGGNHGDQNFPFLPGAGDVFSGLTGTQKSLCRVQFDAGEEVIVPGVMPINNYIGFIHITGFCKTKLWRFLRMKKL